MRCLYFLSSYLIPKTVPKELGVLTYFLTQSGLDFRIARFDLPKLAAKPRDLPSPAASSLDFRIAHFALPRLQ